MKKGIIMDIKNGKAIILTNDGIYEEVKDNGYQIGQKIEYKDKPGFNYLKMVASIAVAFIVPFTGYKAYCTPTSYVYVDINPSMRIDLNMFDKIIDITPLNDDASTLINESEIDRKDIESCVEDIVRICKEKEYLNEENADININYTTSHKELEKKIGDIPNRFDNEFEFKVKELPREERKELEESLVEKGKIKEEINNKDINVDAISENVETNKAELDVLNKEKIEQDKIQQDEKNHIGQIKEVKPNDNMQLDAHSEENQDGFGMDEQRKDTESIKELNDFQNETVNANKEDILIKEDNQKEDNNTNNEKKPIDNIEQKEFDTYEQKNNKEQELKIQGNNNPVYETQQNDNKENLNDSIRADEIPNGENFKQDKTMDFKQDLKDSKENNKNF